MKNALMIFVFTVLVAAFYSYVGQMVPQKETHPPEETEIGSDMTTEQLVEAGRQIVEGKGTCLGCHTMSGESGGRFPDLANVGAVAGSRKPGQSDVEYLAESLYEPNTFIVTGFAPGMPEVDVPPIDLSDPEILAVIAYLQSLGGTPTVNLATELQWQTEENSAPSSAPTQQAASEMSTAEMTGEQIFQTYLCGTCHSLDQPTPMVGPTLYDVGNRLSKSEIYEAVLEPDATVAEGFFPGVMSAQLNATGFYSKISSQQLKTLVEFLEEHKGDS